MRAHDAYQVGSGSNWVQFRFGINSGSNWDQFRINVGSLHDRFKVESGWNETKLNEIKFNNIVVVIHET